MSKEPKTKETETPVLDEAQALHLPSINEPPGSNVLGEAPPTLPPELEFTVTSIAPTEAMIGDDDLTLHVHGTNFTPQAQIVFNGGLEPTTRVSKTELTTIVKPSTATTPGTYPVTVAQGGVTVEPAQEFTFTEAAPSRSRRR